MNNDFNEREVLRLMAQGDEHAFSQLYDHYWETIYKVAYKLLRSSSHADDVVQEVFIKMWTRRADLPKVHNLNYYLIACVRNSIFSHFKAIALQHKITRDYAASFDYTVDNVEDTLLDKQYDTLVNEAIDHLPRQQQVVYRKAKVEGLSYSDISKELGITRGTVRWYMVESLRAIKQKIAPYMSFKY